MGLEIVGDVENLSEVQIDFFEDVLRKQGFDKGTVTVESVGKIGDNYMANIKRLVIDSNEGKFKMIAKVAPKQEMLRAMTNTSIAFQNEAFMYSEVLPKYIELQKSVGTPDEDLLRYPACYGVLLETPNEIIVLEDLKELGFGIRDRFYSLSDKEVKMMLKNLGTLHALGFVLKAKEPECFAAAKKKLANIWKFYAELDEFKKMLETTEANFLPLLDSDFYRECAKGKLVNLWEPVKQFIEMEEGSPHVCIVQGDCWITNIMFKNQDTEECIMIDYQLSRVTSPIVDLMYFIFNCTDQEIRQTHYFEWIDYYYGVFSRVLGRFCMDAKEVYSRVQIHKDMKHYGSLMYGLTTFFLNMSIKESDEIKDIKSLTDEEFQAEFEKFEEYSDVGKFKATTLERFKKRLNGLTKSFVEYGYI